MTTAIDVHGLSAEVSGPLVTITQAMIDAQANAAAKLVLFHSSEVEAARTEAELVAANILLVEAARNTHNDADASQAAAEAAYLTEIQHILSLIQPPVHAPTLPIPLPG